MHSLDSRFDVKRMTKQLRLHVRRLSQTINSKMRLRLAVALAASIVPALATQKDQLPFINDVAYEPASASALPSLNDLLVVNQDISM